MLEVKHYISDTRSKAEKRLEIKSLKGLEHLVNIV